MIVSLEGNIASGKSSALAELGPLLPGFATVHEPLDTWGDLLELFYDDPAAWGLAFSLKVLHGFHGKNTAAAAAPTVVERSPAACRNVFTQLLYNSNHLSPAAWEVFKEYHDILGWEPDAYIYVHVPAEVCFERMQARGRACETGVTLDYLRRVEFQYHNMLKFTEVPVHRVDGTRPGAEVAAEIAAIVRAL